MKAVIVVGASAGGMQALRRLASEIPRDIQAPLLVVQHMPAHGSAQGLVRELGGAGELECVEARSGDKLESGRIFVAPADHHLMVADGHVIISKGARENRSRPSIDCLFRSAAVAYGNRVIGIVLTGFLDDGSLGLNAIERCGGTCVIQDPDDAEYPDMPRAALRNVKRPHVVPLAEMGGLVSTLVLKTRGKRRAPPRDIVIEAKIAQRVLSDMKSVDALGTQAPFNCPGCGGVLWEVHSEALRFRCHTGHAYSANDLLTDQSAKIEETLWVALRMFEERRNLVVRMNERGTSGLTQTATAERLEDATIHIARIRAMLKMGETVRQADQPATVGAN